MFTEVRQAILPLALRRISRRDDLGRAGLLIESLARHWRGPHPFEVLIVAPRRDVEELRSSLPRFPNIAVSVRSESDFFPLGSRRVRAPPFFQAARETGAAVGVCRAARARLPPRRPGLRCRRRRGNVWG